MLKKRMPAAGRDGTMVACFARPRIDVGPPPTEDLESFS
jgi:hypothetical protein